VLHTDNLLFSIHISLVPPLRPRLIRPYPHPTSMLIYPQVSQCLQFPSHTNEEAHLGWSLSLLNPIAFQKRKEVSSFHN